MTMRWPALPGKSFADGFDCLLLFRYRPTRQGVVHYERRIA
ncbi:hypothetical protein BSIN_5310 [Burkholderia singularis]|uniref:Uncharacterized protein n=1 Tax=Burkholderia singularis TaxID=1503053 RepID=A0A238HDR4_9BURK|nr:hypothetical protein BSIN_5310 [Burkholderia singularis]